VSSVGWVWDPERFPFTARNPGIGTIRHAVAVDERRAFFRQNLMQPAERQDLLEVWFPGVHADVGGGYPDTAKDGGIWRAPFLWILGEAQKAGLLVNPQRLKTVLQKTQASPRPWDDMQHESLTLLWWLAEFFPKLQWRKESSVRWPVLGLGRHRYIESQALIHRTTLERLRETCYAPTNFSRRFLEKVRQLPDVPETLPFEW
jgi:uncharacterized protein (DUF2235 family)